MLLASRSHRVFLSIPLRLYRELISRLAHRPQDRLTRISQRTIRSQRTLRLRPTIRIAVSLGIGMTLGLPGPAWGGAKLTGRFIQSFLGRAHPEGYRNYAVVAPRNYVHFRSLVRKRFDDFGNYLLEGHRPWRWEELRPGEGKGFNRREDGSFQAVNPVFVSNFRSVIMAQDQSRGWNVALSISEILRTHLTSLTYSGPRYAGVRLDVSSEKNRGTLLLSRGWTQFRTDVDLKPGGGPRFNYSTSFDNPKAVQSPTPFFGLRWETDIGDAVTLGTTLVNQHHQDVTLKESLLTARGSLPYPMLPPEQVILHFFDDSPDDGVGGAVVYDVRVRVIAEGDSVLTRFAPTIVGGQVVGDHLQANGNTELSFAYDMPISPLPVAMEVEAVVANDYRIGVSQSHKFFNRFTEQVDAEGNEVQFEDRLTEPTIITRALGNVRDLSNKALVKFRYGFNTGQTIYGADIRANLLGAHVEGEIALSSTYQQFSTRPGEQLSPFRDSAWFLTALRPFAEGLVDVGLEFFRIGPKYASYQGTRGGPTLYSDNGGNSRDQASATEYPWVEDNDDRDQWADDDLSEELLGPGSFNQDSGNFPGQDEDLDGTFDGDRNENARVDWEDPFLLYYSDPVEFVFGWDNNNNGFIDERENDERPDYRYAHLTRQGKDVEGGHAFVRFSPLRDRLKWGEASVTLGLFDQEELADGGINRGRYMRTSYRYEAKRWGTVELDHESKRVRDTIPNSVYVFGITVADRDVAKASGPISGDPGFDRLTFKNSMAHQVWLGTAFTGVLNLHIDNNFKLLQNHQLPESSQGDVRLSTFTMVNRADYKLRFGRWTVWPQFKRLTLIEREGVKGRAGLTLRNQSWTAPILRVDYQLSKRSKVLFGQQGLRVGDGRARITLAQLLRLPLPRRDQP